VQISLHQIENDVDNVLTYLCPEYPGQMGEAIPTSYTHGKVAQRSLKS